MEGTVKHIGRGRHGSLAAFTPATAEAYNAAYSQWASDIPSLPEPLYQDTIDSAGDYHGRWS